MPAIVDILRKDPEPLPEWLAADPPRFDREKFFACRTVYYPGSGDDGHPVKLCALSHAAHAFVYVDQGVDQETRAETLRDPERRLRGYAVAYQERLTEEKLRPGGWTSRVSPEEAKRSARFKDNFAAPFAWFVALDRRQGFDDDHGPEHLAILFVGGDGIASYDAMYCQGDNTPPPFLAVIQDHGTGGNWTTFGDEGVLARIARERRMLPEYLLVARNSRPWRGYADVGAFAEPGGIAAHPRCLFLRNPA